MGLGGTDPTSQTKNRFRIDDDIKIYAWNDTQPANLDSALLIAGPISEFSYDADETSAFDDHPSTYFSYGNDCYMREFFMRVPTGLEGHEWAIDKWIEAWIEYHEEDGPWVNN